MRQRNRHVGLVILQQRFTVATHLAALSLGLLWLTVLLTTNNYQITMLLLISYSIYDAW